MGNPSGVKPEPFCTGSHTHTLGLFAGNGRLCFAAWQFLLPKSHLIERHLMQV